MTGPRTPYAILHLAPDAPTSVVNAAFRALSRELHPDVGGDTAAMAALAAARDVLLDPRRRSELDSILGREERRTVDQPPPAALVVMPWGKHRGYDLGSIPSDYLEWLVERASATSDGLRQDVADVLAWRRR